MRKRRENPGWFKKGHDKRRHQLTAEECRKGYRAAVARYGYDCGHWLLWRVKRHRQRKERRRPA